jgi:hypothetical protein
MDESMKAFSVLFSRAIAKNPDLMLEIEKVKPRGDKGNSWKDLYAIFQQEDKRTRFLQQLEEATSSYDWTPINDTFAAWGRYGWITDSELGQFGFWDSIPPTQEEADQKVIQTLDDQYLATLRKELSEQTSNNSMFSEACSCFDNQYFYACASLLTAFIDGVLISSSANFNSANRKTGEGASKKVIEELSKDDYWGSPGYFNLELINYNAFIEMFFARANGFEHEPQNLNRNFIHHGMSNRTISRVDCIKLLIAYRATIRMSKLQNDTAK